MKKASEQKIFAKAYEIKEKIINSSKIINEIRYQYLKTYVRRSYEILDENIFYQNCQKLIELGEEYQNIFKNKKLPKIFIPPILHKDVLSVITGVPSGKRGITTLRIFLTIYDPFIFNA